MASKRQLRRKQCEGKVKHVNKPAAVLAMIQLKRKQGEAQLSTYKCKFCGFWHFGHFSLV